MSESYSDLGDESATPDRQSPMMVAEPSTSFARGLIAQLLPGADPDKLVLALLAERESSAGGARRSDRYNSDEQVATRELRRVRSHLALGESASALQHAFNNPLTALLAEAQLLELETLSEEHRAAVARVLALARRLVVLSRKLGLVDPESSIG